jgi:hypothetical protein
MSKRSRQHCFQRCIQSNRFPGRTSSSLLLLGQRWKSSPAHPVTVAGTGEPDPRGKATVTWCDPRKNYMRRRGKEHCASAMSAFISCSLCDVTVGGILMKCPRRAQKWGALNIALPESPVRIDMMMDTNCSDSLRIRHTQPNEVRGIF